MEGPYSGFSEIYDHHMRFVPYDRWVQYIQEIVVLCGLTITSVADLGCGTGNTALPWARMGLRTIGIDASSAMLERAARKAAEEGVPLELIQRDIRDFTLDTRVDLITCLYDTVNYLTERGSVEDMFRAVRRNLAPQGLFIFDLNSRHKLSTVTKDTFYFEEDHYHLIWQQQYREDEEIWSVRLTGFIRDEDGRFRLFREEHKERAYSRSEIKESLGRAGLRPVACFKAYTFNSASSTDDRFYFVAEGE